MDKWLENWVDEIMENWNDEVISSWNQIKEQLIRGMAAVKAPSWSRYSTCRKLAVSVIGL